MVGYEYLTLVPAYHEDIRNFAHSFDIPVLTGQFSQCNHYMDVVVNQASLLLMPNLEAGGVLRSLWRKQKEMFIVAKRSEYDGLR